MKQEAPRNASDRPETSSTATTAASASTTVPARFRLDARTRRIGLEGVAAAKAILAEQAARRATRDASRAAAKAGAPSTSAPGETPAPKGLPRPAHRRAA